MGMATEMRDLTQEIRASHDARTAWEADLRTGTAALLKGFQSDRRQAFQAMMQELQARHRERNREVADFLNSFRRRLNSVRRELQEAASHWRTMALNMARKRAGAR